MTAADLCAELSISSEAVSTAVKQLIPLGLIERVPAPGSRRDHRRFRQGAWASLMSQQNAMLATMGAAAQEGLDAAGEDSITGRRLHEMKDFYAYMAGQLIPLIDSWREHYAANRAGILRRGCVPPERMRSGRGPAVALTAWLQAVADYVTACFLVIQPGNWQVRALGHPPEACSTLWGCGRAGDERPRR
jgi:hypothetical protein